MPANIQEHMSKAEEAHPSSAKSEQSSKLSTQSCEDVTKGLPGSSSVTSSNNSTKDEKRHLRLGDDEAGGHCEDAPTSIPSDTFVLSSPLTRRPIFESHILCQASERTF